MPDEVGMEELAILLHDMLEAGLDDSAFDKIWRRAGKPTCMEDLSRAQRWALWCWLKRRSYRKKVFDRWKNLDFSLPPY